MCNVTMLRGKESELHVWEVEHYRLYLGGLTSMHSVRTGTKLLDWGLTLFFAETAQGVSWQAGLGVLTSPQFGIAASLSLSWVDERLASLHLMGYGGREI